MVPPAASTAARTDSSLIPKEQVEEVIPRHVEQRGVRRGSERLKSAYQDDGTREGRTCRTALTSNQCSHRSTSRPYRSKNSI